MSEANLILVSGRVQMWAEAVRLQRARVLAPAPDTWKVHRHLDLYFFVEALRTFAHAAADAARLFPQTNDEYQAFRRALPDLEDIRVAAIYGTWDSGAKRPAEIKGGRLVSGEQLQIQWSQADVVITCQDKWRLSVAESAERVDSLAAHVLQEVR